MTYMNDRKFLFLMLRETSEEKPLPRTKPHLRLLRAVASVASPACCVAGLLPLRPVASPACQCCVCFAPAPNRIRGR